MRLMNQVALLPYYLLALASAIGLSSQIFFIDIEGFQFYACFFVYIGLLLHAQPAFVSIKFASILTSFWIFLLFCLIPFITIKSIFFYSQVYSQIIFKLIILALLSTLIAFSLKKSSSFGTLTFLAKCLDIAIMILALFGIFQMFSCLTGNIDNATFLHNLFENSKYGGPVDYRGGYVRVSSLTWEPGYLTPVSTIIFAARCILSIVYKIDKLSVLSVLFYSFCMVLSSSQITILTGFAWLLCFTFKRNRYFLIVSLLLLNGYDIFMSFYPPFLDLIIESSRFDLITKWLSSGGVYSALFGFSPDLLTKFFSFGGSILYISGIFGLAAYTIFIVLFCSRLNIKILPFFIVVLVSVSSWSPWTFWPTLPLFFGLIIASNEFIGSPYTHYHVTRPHIGLS